MTRTANLKRTTKETNIEVTLNLDGQRKIEIQTGLGFFDHMLTALAFHAGWDLQLTCKGDLHMDDHHTVEDCALTLGAAVKESLGDKQGIKRFAAAYAPLDESLARTVIDFSGRPSSVIELGLERETIGQVACENLTHFFQSLATAGLFTLHVDVLRGTNDHHRAEAAFKSLALAIREASEVRESAGVPSTKGAL